MLTRHTLYHRPEPWAPPKPVRVFQTYAAAVAAGMRECGHGKFWVDSEHRHLVNQKWTEFCPEPVHMMPNGNPEEQEL